MPDRKTQIVSLPVLDEHGEFIEGEAADVELEILFDGIRVKRINKEVPEDSVDMVIELIQNNGMRLFTHPGDGVDGSCAVSLWPKVTHIDEVCRSTFKRASDESGFFSRIVVDHDYSFPLNSGR